MEGKNINGFIIQKLIGYSTMAEVWCAEKDNRYHAAVKVIHRDLLKPGMLERIRNEAKIIIQLNHPNICHIYDYEEIDRALAIIMEYLDGKDMESRIKQGQKFTNDELIKWWNQSVDGLNYIHSKCIIHGNIKPSNIFVDKNGDVKLLDIGIDKLRQSIYNTHIGAIISLGTNMYKTPEQLIHSRYIGPKSDNYSLAVTFVHLLTGNVPYSYDNDYYVITDIIEKPLDISVVPESWRGFLAPYLEKNPEKRPELRHFEI